MLRNISKIRTVLAVTFFMLIVFTYSNFVLAASSNTNSSENVDPMISGIRYSKQPPIGNESDNKLRVVFDVNGKVLPDKVQAKLSTQPNALVLNISNVSINKNLRPLEIAKESLVSKVNLISDGKTTKAIMYTPTSLTDKDYKITVLPDLANGVESTRIVVDLLQQTEKKISDIVKKTPVNITQVRYSTLPSNKDTETTRLVFDLDETIDSDSVEAQISKQPNALVLNFKNVEYKKKINTLKLDGRVATKIDFVKNQALVKAMVYVPESISEDNYKLIILPPDLKTKKPARVVLDIIKQKNKDVFSKKINTPGLKGKVIVLDPGHGGSDSGAIGLYGTKEKDITLPVAKMVKSLLVKAGAKVIMTRENDVDVFGLNASDVEELSARVRVPNRVNADVFISIHADAVNNREVNGTACFYYEKTAKDKLLARVLQKGLMGQIDTEDRGTREGNFHVLRNAKMPATLIELAFISNPEEEKLLKNSLFQQRCAVGIVQGLNNYFLVAD